MQRFPGIGFKDDSPYRRAWLMGTPYDVWQVVDFLDSFDSPESIAAKSDLSEAEVRLALAYYAEYPEEIDEAVQENRRPLDELRREYPSLFVD
jgi:uncharacterized protein (DUF433 family)